MRPDLVFESHNCDKNDKVSRKLVEITLAWPLGKNDSPLLQEASVPYEREVIDPREQGGGHMARPEERSETRHQRMTMRRRR
jgi:hypothetical protein